MPAKRWARIQYRVGRSVAWWGWNAGAAQIFHEALEDDPSLIEAHFGLCEALVRGDRWDEAGTAYRALAQRLPSSVEVQGNLVLSLGRAGDLDGAIDALERLIRLRPFQAELHLLAGALYRKRRRHGDAIRAFRWAVGLGSSATLARFQLGEGLLGAQHWLALLHWYRSALSVPPSPEAALSALNAPPLPVMDPVSDEGARGRPLATKGEDRSVFQKLGLRLGEWGLLTAGRWHVLMDRYRGRNEPHLAIRRYREAWGLRRTRLGPSSGSDSPRRIGDLGTRVRVPPDGAR